MSSGRSQLQNKHEAVRRLQSALENKVLNQEKEQVKEGWQNHNELDRGNPVRVFTGSDFKPVPQRKK